MSEKTLGEVLIESIWPGRQYAPDHPDRQASERAAKAVRAAVLLREHDRLQATYESIVQENKRLERLCPGCGDLFLAYTVAGMPYGPHYCTQQCADDFRSKHYPPAQPTAETPAERNRWRMLDAVMRCYWDGYRESVDDWTYKQAVQETAKMLAEVDAEIEKRTEGK